MTHPRSHNLLTCPNCGAELPAKAPACPDCGADEQTGWSDNTIYDGTGIEDPDEFDYPDWQRRANGRQSPPSRRKIVTAVVAIFMLVLFVFLLLR